MEQISNHIEEFERARPMLIGLAYRLLGTRAEAEDVVQDAFLAWSEADRASIERPRGWLSSVVTRKALDVLKSARRSRTEYVGSWLPEPMETVEEGTPETDLLVSESVTMAFLLVLERLAPKERAAFILHDVFGMEYGEIAKSLEIGVATCRKLASRARVNVRSSGNTKPAPKAVQQKLVEAFQAALRTGVADGLAAMLSSHAVLTADSGGKADSIRKPLLGAELILQFVTRYLGRWYTHLQLAVAEINAQAALIARDGAKTEAVITFAVGDDDLVTEIMITRNPDKLRHFDLPH
ncbi:RNA polymerase sigma factor SigJ [Nisaea acidiphila]|uniref:RNA polymerase sigma factor SigJ n=1 Tax=Nisaea acidiphila TaxID=1862145 RepID=A0A9J7APS1_9PROT|nr:RNA polymerase sigma factor SigJ [Nisaea acidiphila]UUX48593.1 RNA polymerase sigma factor SigJ [Nisaea acidiphila]